MDLGSGIWDFRRAFSSQIRVVKHDTEINNARHSGTRATDDRLYL